MDAQDYQENEGVDEAAPIPMEAIEIKHYSAGQIDSLHKQIKSIIKPSRELSSFKDAVEAQKNTKDKRTTATNLFMKSLILAQEGKVEMSQSMPNDRQKHSLAFPDLQIRCSE